MFKRTFGVAAFVVATLLPLLTPAFADSTTDGFLKDFGAGAYGEAAAGLKELVAAGEVRAKAGAGALGFVGAVERLGQNFYRYGMRMPEAREIGMVAPLARLPIPVNPAPEKLTYAAFRTVLETFVADLDRAEANMAALGDAEVKFPVDFTQVRLDFNGNGQQDPGESLGEIMQAMAMQTGTQQMPPAFKVNFDTADIYWLRAYSRLLSSMAQFLLAHDFETSFNASALLFFPAAGDDTAELLAKNKSVQPYVSGEIGDVIALLHLTNWPVVDAAKREDVRKRLLDVTGLAPKTWAAARKETDDDLEWLPNAKQKQGITGTVLTDQEIDGWLSVMAELNSILEGKKLLPHWRFDRGMNLKRWFAEETRYDLVLLATGTTAVRYLEEGPVSDQATWNRLTSAFSGSFMGYAVWFN
jgi:hypothetical protein